VRALCLRVWSVAPLLLTACAVQSGSSPGGRPPPLVLGAFEDDYGVRYQVSEDEWIQLPGARYHIVRWNSRGQYLVARNDERNASHPGLWTRIDWVRLPGMAPYTWGFCYSAYAAPSMAVAETVSVARTATPRTGCNGFPFSRMRPSRAAGS
jgi:hypothetical protein